MSPQTPPKYFSFLSVFYVSSQEHCDGSCFFSPYNLLYIMTYVSQTCRNCRTVLIFLSTERSERRTFIIVAIPRICETSKREGWMCTIGTAFNFGCVYKIYVSAVATSGRPERSLNFFPFSLYSINFFQPGFTCSDVPQTSNWLNPNLNECLHQVGKK